MKRPRLRFTVLSLMIGVAVIALLANGLRPLSEREAVEVATRRFRQIPGAERWTQPRTRSYQADDGKGQALWVVNFLDPKDDRPIAQVSTSPRGTVLSVVVSLPGSAAPLPVEFLTEPIPPPRGQ